MDNESTLDRAIRIVIGAVILSFAFFGPKSLWGLVGLIPLATGILGVCPLYKLFGISTCHTRRPSAPVL